MIQSRPPLLTLTLTIGVLALSGCGRVPVDIQRAVSPCIDLPKAAGFAPKTVLADLLTADFKQKDADGDGIVTLAEAQAKPNKPNLIDDKLMKALGSKDGKLTQNDLAKAGDVLVDWAQHYKNQLLDRYDKNHDHAISFDEVKGLFDIDDAAFKAADEKAGNTPGNGDGKLDADEFLGLVLHQNAQSTGCTGTAQAASLVYPAHH